MATTVTGTNVSNWESYFKYTLTNVDGGSYKVTMDDSGIHNLSKYDFAISSGISCTSYIGSTTKSGSGGFTSSGQSDTYKDIVGSWYKTISKTHSAQTVTLKAVTKNSSGFQNGTSTASKSITIPARTSYTVGYNANGGSGAPSSQTKWFDETLTLSSTKPTRTGYTFKGWGTSSTATTASKQPGNTYTDNKAVTYYAVWQANTYAVKYDGNGGTAPDDTSRTYGQDFTLSATVPTLDRYKFTGWLCAGTVYDVGATVTSMGTIAADLTFVAQWELDQYTVSYNANGGDGSMEPVSVQYGNAYAAPECGFTRKWFIFAGWFDVSGNKVTGYDADYRGGNVTLYAMWTQVYFPPALGGLAADRYDTDAKELSDSGTAAQVTGYFAVTGSEVTDSTGTTYDGTLDSIAVSKDGQNVVTAETVDNTFAAIFTYGGTGLITDSAHVLTVTVTDKAWNSATATVILPKAEFTLDFAAGGKGVGVGCPAPQSGFEVAFPVSGSGFLDFIWPVGSIYQTTDTAFDPNTTWGGTWEHIKDAFLLAAGDTYAAGDTGGEPEHTLTEGEMPSHSHSASTASSGGHTHGTNNTGDRFLVYNYSTAATGVSERAVAKATSGNYMAPVVNNADVDWAGMTYTASAGGHTHTMTVESTGSGAAHNNMPPYVAVNVWKRTA